MLPEAARGKSIVLFQDQMFKSLHHDQLPAGKQLIYAVNHHNACDSIYVAFSEIDAAYGATASAAAGCGSVVDGAPERRGEDWHDGIWYQIKYPGQGWGERKVHPTRHHFLLQNFF
jgi:hypothetical protein